MLKTILQWLVPLAFLRLGFGGDSISTQKTDQYDNRITAGSGAVVAKDGSSVSVSSSTNYSITDGGAFSLVQNVTDSAIKNVAGAFTQASASVDAAYQDAKGRGAMTDKILLSAMVLMALVAVAAMRRGKP